MKPLRQRIATVLEMVEPGSVLGSTLREAADLIGELQSELDAVERTALAHEQTAANLDALCGPGGYGGSYRVRLLIRDVRADISASRRCCDDPSKCLSLGSACMARKMRAALPG